MIRQISRHSPSCIWMTYAYVRTCIARTQTQHSDLKTLAQESRPRLGATAHIFQSRVRARIIILGLGNEERTAERGGGEPEEGEGAVLHGRSRRLPQMEEERTNNFAVAAAAEND